MKSGIQRLMMVLLWSGLATAVSAQTFVRKPFLQKGSYNKATVCWRVSAATALTVRYGTDSANLSISSPASPSAVDACIALDSNTLLPNTKYFYEVYNGTTRVVGSAKQSFITSPPVGSKKKSNFWILGDVGSVAGDAGSGGVVQRNVKNGFLKMNQGAHLDGLLLDGDIAYENGTDAEFTTNLFTPYGDVFATYFTWPAIGNHEATSSGGGSPTGAYYLSAFNLPTAGEIGGVPSGSELYYSFNYGNIHFIILDSQVSPRATTGAQYLWLRQDLMATQQDWIVVMWHHPPYSRSGHNSDTENQLFEMRQNFVPLLEQYGVDMVFCGHSHAWERTYLLDSAYGFSDNGTRPQSVPARVIKDSRSGNPTTTGPYRKPLKGAHNGAVYTVVGSSAKLDPVTAHPLLFVQYSVYGSGLLTVEDTVATAKFIDSTGAIREQFQIVKTRGTVDIHGRPGLKGDQKFSQAGRRFRFPTNNATPFRIYSVSGDMISTSTPTGNWLPAKTILPGVYFFRYGSQFGKITLP